MKTTFIEMKQKDILPLKEKIWLRNNKRCPLLQIEIDLAKGTLDHIHKLKNEEYSEQKGTIRNCIEFRANAMEGKITNNWKRYFGSDESKHPIKLSDYLRNLADYLDNGAYVETYENDDAYFVHPTEVPKPKYIKKSCYNKLAKIYDMKAKLPEFKDKMKLSQKLESLFKKYNIEIEYY